MDLLPDDRAFRDTIQTLLADGYAIYELAPAEARLVRLTAATHTGRREWTLFQLLDRRLDPEAYVRVSLQDGRVSTERSARRY
jgi:hypothetical protein